MTSQDFWTWVAIEGTAELSPVAADPHDATVDELVTYYRALRGEHEDWDAYRATMVARRRLVVRLRPEHTYGQMRADPVSARPVPHRPGRLLRIPEHAK